MERIGLTVLLAAATRTMAAAEPSIALKVGESVRVDTPAGWVKGVVVSIEESAVVVQGRHTTARVPIDWRIVRGGARQHAAAEAVAGGAFTGAAVGLAVGLYEAGWQGFD